MTQVKEFALCPLPIGVIIGGALVFDVTKLQSWQGALLTIILSLISLIVAIVIGYLMYSRKKLSYKINSFSIITSDGDYSDDIEIFYNQQSISNLTETRVTFYNDGNQLIDGQDITAPLALDFGNGATVFGVKLSGDVPEANVHYSFNGAKVEFGFTHLTPKEKLTLAIVLTRTPGSVAGVELNGRIKGIKSIRKRKADMFDETSLFRQVLQTIYFYYS